MLTQSNSIKKLLTSTLHKPYRTTRNETARHVITRLHLKTPRIKIVDTPNTPQEKKNTKHRMKTILKERFCLGGATSKIKNRNKKYLTREYEEKSRDESEGCVTMIEYDCENNYSLIYNSLNEMLK